MSVLIGIVSALLIVALVIILVLRVQCTRNDERKNRQKACPNASGGIRAERRGSGSVAALSDKGGGSPISKHESSAGECDSDEKNPDVIPLGGVDGLGLGLEVDASSDYARKRQHVSTIETSSPSRNLMPQAGNSTGYMGGYCTLRNGMPLHELAAAAQQTKMLSGGPGGPMLPPYSSCTLPRQPPPPQWQYGPVGHLPPVGMYRPSAALQYRGGGARPRPPLPSAAREPPIAMQPLMMTTTAAATGAAQVALEEEPSVETPLMGGQNKRESTV